MQRAMELLEALNMKLCSAPTRNRREGIRDVIWDFSLTSMGPAAQLDARGAGERSLKYYIP